MGGENGPEAPDAGARSDESEDSEMDDLKTCLGAMYFDSVMMRKGKRPACYGLTQSRPMKQPPLPARVKQLPDVRTLPPPSVEKASLSIGYSVSLRSLEIKGIPQRCRGAAFVFVREADAGDSAAEAGVGARAHPNRVPGEDGDASEEGRSNPWATVLERSRRGAGVFYDMVKEERAGSAVMRGVVITTARVLKGAQLAWARLGGHGDEGPSAD